MYNLLPRVTFTLPRKTTWKSAIDAVESIVENDEVLVLWQPSAPGIKRRLREMTLSKRTSGIQRPTAFLLVAMEAYASAPAST